MSHGGFLFTTDIFPFNKTFILRNHIYGILLIFLDARIGLGTFYLYNFIKPFALSYKPRAALIFVVVHSSLFQNPN